MPPSKKCPTGKMLTPTGVFGVYGHGEISFSEFVVPQKGSPLGTLGGPTQSAGSVAEPPMRTGPPVGPPTHLKTLTVALAPLDWKSVRTRTSPSMCAPLNDPFANGETSSWKNQTPSVAVPEPSKRSAPK